MRLISPFSIVGPQTSVRSHEDHWSKSVSATWHITSITNIRVKGSSPSRPCPDDKSLVDHRNAHPNALNPILLRSGTCASPYRPQRKQVIFTTPQHEDISRSSTQSSWYRRKDKERSFCSPVSKIKLDVSTSRWRACGCIRRCFKRLQKLASPTICEKRDPAFLPCSTMATTSNIAAWLMNSQRESRSDSSSICFV